MKTRNEERELLRSCFDWLKRSVNRNQYVGHLLRDCMSAISELRQERTNARRDADSKAEVLANLIRVVTNRESTIGRLRQERDAWKDSDTISGDLAERYCKERDAYKAEVERRTEDVKKLLKRGMRSIADGILQQTIDGRDREHAVAMRALTERNAQVRELTAELNELQKDRDATRERLRHALEEGAQEQQDKWDNAMIVTLNRRLVRANKHVRVYARQLNTIHDTFDCGADDDGQ